MLRYINRICLSACLLWTGFATVHAAGESDLPTISLIVDGKGIVTDVAPQIKNARMLVPIRAIAENTGASIQYDANDKRVVVKQNGKQMTLYLGQTFAYVDGKKTALDTSPLVSNGRTLIPVRFISETLGYQVTWDSEASVATVKTAHKKDSQTNTSTDISQTYIVQSGDTLTKIANDHNTSVEALKKRNHLPDSYVEAEQLLFLPDGAKSSLHPLTEKVSAKTLLSSKNIFPLAADSGYEKYYDTFGDGRSWDGESYQENIRKHEGIDIMAPRGTPVYSVTDGIINRIGWNSLGGWRVNITDQSGSCRLYYAHLEAYAPGLQVGDRIKAGQLLGFVGDSGYGDVGTTGKFDTHLHFGLYDANTNQAFNPYYYLQYWENHQFIR